MTRADQDVERPQRGLSRKHGDITRAAREVFGRVGYLMASIDMIASEAGVSTRTIYNHFDNKEHLFAAVVTESSRRVVQAHEAIIERHLSDVTDAETALVELARTWVRPLPEFVDHFAIVRRINAEHDHFPRELFEAWQEAGPRRVQRTLAARMAAMHDRGLLRAEDPHFAAHHFAVLLNATLAARARDAGRELGEAELDEVAEEVVRAFLYGYLPPAER
ncbi:TetR/AcrR family transcriptional regulator [Saccharothrix syringae]|uniref:TetR family transcriptional regulator n=1 Tax=Saccharothrix syringae TaxID=103733 RepID=A0A5Q0H5C5_SACSY|nr:TetR/AcrR family transcriptional regulator [Saccharothrix syringae]QFZ21451.1 TetR family transcriptional regulator [Saccharothrix syringae]